MEFSSLTFLLFVALVVLAYNASRNQVYRTGVLTIANIIFISSYLTAWPEVFPLISFLIIAYSLLEAVRSIRSTSIFVIGLTLILAIFIYLKRFSFISDIPSLPFPYITIGLSYILFRVLHLLIDAHDGELPSRIDPLSFANYTCNFLSFVSGPIQRYQQFNYTSYTDNTLLDQDHVFLALRRIITGYLKLIVISGVADRLFVHFSTNLLSPIGSPNYTTLLFDYTLAAILFTIYLYYNFSGYMDIIIGIGNLINQNLPENFNKPFLARDFLEFWTRWHMTLSEWFKTYLFNPLMQALMTRFPQAKLVPYLGVAAFFITFLIMGLWHGTTAIFVIYGLLMGAGASVTRTWHLMLVKAIGRSRYRALGESRTYSYFCRGLVCAYFAQGITCLWVDLSQAEALWKAIGLSGAIGAFALLTLGSATAFFLWDRARYLATSVFGSARALTQRGIIGNFWAGGEILAILSVFSFFHKAPEFVYRGF